MSAMSDHIAPVERTTLLPMRKLVFKMKKEFALRELDEINHQLYKFNERRIKIEYILETFK